MTRVSITQLKARLSRYLREVKRGGEVQVLERGVPVARIVGVGSAPVGRDPDRRRRLVEAGILRPGSGDSSGSLPVEPLPAPSGVREALDDGRQDRV